MNLFAELGMRYPLIQAPMAGVQNSALALAVTGAGCLGSLPAAMLSPTDLRSELGLPPAVWGHSTSTSSVISKGIPIRSRLHAGNRRWRLFMPSSV